MDLKNLGLTLWYIGLGLEKYLNYLTGFGLISWYIRVTREKYSDYLTGFELILSYVGLGLNLLDSDLFYYNQAGMLLEKYENLLELSVKQLLIESSLASSISIDQAMCGVKNQNVNVVRSKVRYFSYPTRVIQIQF